MEDYSQELDELIALYKANEYDKALEKAQDLLDKYPNNINVTYRCSWVLINFGKVTKKAKLIKQGVEKAEQQLESLDYLAKLPFYLLLFNGYWDLEITFTSDTEQKDIRLKRKKCCQNILLYRKKLTSEALDDTINNYAVSLREEERNIEAIDYYYDSLASEPDNSIFMKNLGEALFDLGNITEKNYERNFIYYKSYELLKQAESFDTSSDSLIQDSLIKIENCLKSNQTIDFYEFLSLMNFIELCSVQQELQKLWQPSPYLKFIKHQRLLLTINPKVLYDKQQYKDNLSLPNVMTNNIDKEKNKTLCYIFNQIKEEFSTARYLYYQSFSQNKELTEVSQITEYIDTLDFADFSLKSGLLKTSLRLAVDLLDKCAGFLNLYLELDNDPTRVMWSNVWYEKLKYKKSFENSLNPIICEKLEYNWYLKALVNVRKDLYEKEYEDFYPFKFLRDYVTHQGITLHQKEVTDESKLNYSLEQMQEETYFLLRMVKAAIVYLVGVVMIEEREKEKNTNNLVDTQFYMKPGLSDRTIN